MDDSGITLIAAERRRQIEEEGWSSEHDDEYDKGQLADAAGCYASSAASQEHWNIHVASNSAPSDWPWPDNWWKPSADPIRNLVKAGALIAAEIDRLNRKAKSDEQTGSV